MNTDTASDPANFELHLEFATTGERVFAAVASLEGAKEWWTKSCEGSEEIGGQSSYRFPGGGFFAEMRTVRREFPCLLEWECMDSRHDASTGYSDLADWIGTRIRFEVQDLGNGKSRLDFTHFGLNRLECLSACSSGWSFFLNESLRGYLETGRGQPWDQRPDREASSDPVSAGTDTAMPA